MRALATAGRDRVVARYSQRQIAADTVQVYQTILANSGILRA